MPAAALASATCVKGINGYGCLDGTVSLENELGRVEIFPVWPDGFEGCWTWDQDAVKRQGHLLTWHRIKGRNVVYRKGYSKKATGEAVRQKLKTIWKESRFHTERGNAEIEALGLEFDNPKPLALIEDILSTFSANNLTVLDSFSGSGTTAHAALRRNSLSDAGWKFILIEGEKYADKVTAERARRAIKGWPKSNLPEFRKPLGGEFTFCTLGPPLELDRILDGSALPTVEALAGLLWHTATAAPLEPGRITAAPEIGHGVVKLGVHGEQTYWLIYKPDRGWLRSTEAALSLAKARAIAATAPGNHLVFAPARFVSRELLQKEGLKVDYAPLPFALYRLETA
jgi:hypothetical protein